MLSKPIYEALPLSYVIVGGLGITLLDSVLAQAACIIIFLFGSWIYSLRSQNRRTDPSKRRKKGILPHYIYEHIPSLYLLTALLIQRVDSTHIPVITLVLLSYAAYLMVRRRQYRKHKVIDIKLS